MGVSIPTSLKSFAPSLCASPILIKLKDAKDLLSFMRVLERTMFGIGVWELTIIFAIVLVLFGGKRLPSVATGLGQAIRNFRGALKGDEEGKNLELLDKNPEKPNESHKT